MMKRQHRDHIQERNAEILRLHFVEGWNLTEIGEHFGISRERVRQILRAHDVPTLTRERQARAAQAKRDEHKRKMQQRAEEKIKNFPHGTRAGYIRGCTCEECRVANNRYALERKRRVREGEMKIPSHGLSGYTNYGCKCSICKAAGSASNAYQRMIRLKRGLGT